MGSKGPEIAGRTFGTSLTLFPIRKYSLMFFTLYFGGLGWQIVTTPSQYSLNVLRRFKLQTAYENAVGPSELPPTTTPLVFSEIVLVFTEGGVLTITRLELRYAESRSPWDINFGSSLIVYMVRIIDTCSPPQKSAVFRHNLHDGYGEVYRSHSRCQKTRCGWNG